MKSLISLKNELDLNIKNQRDGIFTPYNFVINTSVYSDIKQYESEITSFVKLPKAVDFSKSFLLSNDKAFLNLCPHRGARLEKNLHSETFTCPYHGWEFDLNGVLSKSTGHKCPYPAGSLKLKEITTEKIGGMHFINASDSISKSYIKEINNFSQNSIFLETLSYNVNCNWKLLIESLLETYHFPYAHKSFLEGFENAFFSMSSNEDQNSRIVVPLQNFESFKDTNDFQGINVMYHLFPYSFVLFMNVGFVWFNIEPDKINKSKITYSLFSYQKGNPEDAKKSLNLLEKILDQDFEILEGQQKNIELGVLKKLHLTHYETLIQSFHKNIDKLL